MMCLLDWILNLLGLFGFLDIVLTTSWASFFINMAHNLTKVRMKEGTLTHSLACKCAHTFRTAHSGDNPDRT